jgi:hypothetical protein
MVLREFHSKEAGGAPMNPLGVTSAGQLRYYGYRTRRMTRAGPGNAGVVGAHKKPHRSGVCGACQGALSAVLDLQRLLAGDPELASSAPSIPH